MRARVRAARVARLATLDDGRPHLVPVTFALEGDRVLVAVDDKPKRTRHLKRLANIEADPRVELLVDHYDEDWSRLWWVRLRGTARVTQSADVSALVRKYRQYREAPGGPFIVVDVTGWSGWSADTERGS